MFGCKQRDYIDNNAMPVSSNIPLRADICHTLRYFVMMKGSHSIRIYAPMLTFRGIRVSKLYVNAIPDF